MSSTDPTSPPHNQPLTECSRPAQLTAIMEEDKDLAGNRGHQGSQGSAIQPSIAVPTVVPKAQGDKDMEEGHEGQGQQTPLLNPSLWQGENIPAAPTRPQSASTPEGGSSCSPTMSCSSPSSSPTQTAAPARTTPHGGGDAGADACFRSHYTTDPSPEQQCYRHVNRKENKHEEYEATWALPGAHVERPSLRSEQVPVEMRENYIQTGYRPPGIGVTVSAYSALYLHNETLNFWTHMIPFLYFAYFLFVDQGPWLRLSLITGLGRYPFYGYMVGICTLFGASSFAHLFHCAGHRRWSNVCFVIDYAAISVYGTASAISYYFYSRPRFRGTFIGYMLSGEGQFLGFTTATAWVATYASCITRLRPTRFCYAIRTAAFALPFLTGSFPAIMRWMHVGAVLKGPPAVVVANTTGTSGNVIEDVIANVTASVVMDTGLYRYPQLDYDFQSPYTRHLLMLSGGALINVFKIPERFFPGRFDNIGSSHQWFHILVFTSIREQFWLMLEEIACHSGILYARDPDSSMPWGRATIKEGLSDGAPCTIITSTSSTPHLHGHHSMHGASSSWFYPWGWSWNSLLFCALGNPRSSLDTWMALNTIAWWIILLSSLTITIAWFGYSYNFEFSEIECCCSGGDDTAESSSAQELNIAESLLSSSSSSASSPSSPMSSSAKKKIIPTDPSTVDRSIDKQQGAALRQRSSSQVIQSQVTG